MRGLAEYSGLAGSLAMAAVWVAVGAWAVVSGDLILIAMAIPVECLMLAVSAREWGVLREPNFRSTAAGQRMGRLVNVLVVVCFLAGIGGLIWVVSKLVQ